MNRLAIGALLVLCPSIASAQAITTEVDVSAGYSTERVSAGATQVRAFGEGPGAIRFFGEVAWGARYFPASRPESATDAFGAAYPYENRAQVIEAYGERTFRPGGGLVGIRAGRFRTPFGISTRSDHAYTGFMRAPMIRYDDYFALSNNFLEHGADSIVGAPQAYCRSQRRQHRRMSATVQRRPGFDTVLRGQAYYRLGDRRRQPLSARCPISRSTSRKGRAVFTGVDVRWMHDGIQATRRVDQRPAVRRHDDDGRLHRPAGAPRRDGPGDGGRAARAARLRHDSGVRAVCRAVRWRVHASGFPAG